MSVLSFNDKKKDFERNGTASVYSSNSKLNLLQKRKRASPFNSEMSAHSMNRGDRYVTQRVLSAKAHRVKQLQNQLADAHFHLQELNNENKMLRAMQKKHEIALQRYENSNADLPQVLNSHSEEIRIQQSKFKQIKQQHKEATQKLKERETQLQQLKDEHQHLLELTKDRSLLEREKLQSQVVELTAKVQQQNETIATLQRRIVLEAKNFRHQLQNEMNKHKDTRHDLDMAISNADKLSTIIEMKEKMLSTAASRVMKSPTKNLGNAIKTQLSKANRQSEKNNDELEYGTHSVITKFCETSRNLASVLSIDEETSSAAEPKSKYTRSRSTSNNSSIKASANQSRKTSKNSDEIFDASKIVQDGMDRLSLYDDESDFLTDNDMQSKIESMKTDLLNKIKNNEDPLLKKSNMSNIVDENKESENEMLSHRSSRPNSSFNPREETIVEENSFMISTDSFTLGGECTRTLRREKSGKDRKHSGQKSSDKYCKDIMQDIVKSSKIIDQHITNFTHSKLQSEKLIQQLEAVDKISDLVYSHGDMPEESLNELNNNLKIYNELAPEPISRKRSVSNRSYKDDSKANPFGDASMSNQDLLNDILGK